MTVHSKVHSLKGPILIIGASGFVGSNLFRYCLSQRVDVIGTIFSGDTWRLDGISKSNIEHLNILDINSVKEIFGQLKPKTVFDCSSFGAYSFEHDFERIHQTNYISFIRLIEALRTLEINAYIHAGSSSEYGLNAAGPSEGSELIPNSHYAVSKAATSNAISYFGKVCNFPVANLRLYSVYGPYEDSSRLIPVLCEKSLRGELPIFANENVTRDFIHVDDVVTAFIETALKMSPSIAGESFNIGTGVLTSLRSLAHLSNELFGLKKEPMFSNSEGRPWDVDNWFANPKKANQLLSWSPSISLTEGLTSTRQWWKKFLSDRKFAGLTKKQI